MSLSILYLGSKSTGSTSLYRANALRRIGCDLAIVDPSSLIRAQNKWVKKINYITGYRFIQNALERHLKILLCEHNLSSFDCVWVDSGDLLGPSIIKFLSQKTNAPIVLFNHDDPTGVRDGPRFTQLLKSLPYYSLVVLVRSESALEALCLNARSVLRVHRSYDEAIHQQPFDNLNKHSFDDSIVFAGTLIPGENRDDFINCLISAGLKLRIYGSKWGESRYWQSIKSSYYGNELVGRSYSNVLSSSGVCLGLLSMQNRDLVTTRSFEAPASGALFCGERTSEHQLLFEDGVEAVFWSSIDECIQRCHLLKSDRDLNTLIRSNGFNRILEMGVGSEDICSQVLTSLGLLIA